MFLVFSWLIAWLISVGLTVMVTWLVKSLFG
nr:MAG TPA: hypothetical protein [Bacteriophage sp.]